MSVDQVAKILESFPGARRDKLIPILQEIQEKMGCLNEESIKKVGKHLKLPTSKIFGIATFYDQFSFTPRGKNHIRICHGSTCHMNGGMKLIREMEKLLQIKDGETTKDGQFSLEIVACLGACSFSPVVEINQEFITGCNKMKLKKQIDSIKRNETE